MSDAITLYTNPNSRGRTAHWMLEEVGAPYRVQVPDFEKQEHKTEEYLAINPMGKVPAIVHGDTAVTEAAAICAYLADAFPQAGLAPAVNDRARGPYYRWLFFAAACLEIAMVDRMFSRPLPDRPGALGYGSYADALAALERAITPGPYILGERFSAADVYVGSEIGWGLFSKALEPRQSFREYFDRLSQRPAYQRFFAQNSQASRS